MPGTVSESPRPCNRFVSDFMNATSTYLSKHFLTLPTGAGRVHSIFQHAVNVVLDGTLLTFLPDAGAGLPDSIVLTAADFAMLRQASCDEPVLKRDAAIAIPESRITIRIGDDNRDNAFPAGARLAPAAERIERWEQIRRDLAGFRDDVPPQVKQRSAELANALDNRDLPACERIAASLVGLGSGLTPSGDDVFLGVLAVLRFLIESGGSAPFFRHFSLIPTNPHGSHTNPKRKRGQTESIAVLACASGWCRHQREVSFFTKFTEAVVNLAEGNTTDVSLKYLQCAVQGRFSLPLIASVRSLGEAGHAIDMANLERLVSTGDTSGSEMLSGIVLGFHGVCDAEI